MEKNILKMLEKLNVSLFRINLSHTELTDIDEIIKKIRKTSKVPICIDTEGAQIRTGSFKNNSIELFTNNFVDIHLKDVIGDEQKFNFYPKKIISKLEIGDLISIDFNNVLATVTEKTKDKVTLRILNGGKVGQNKAVTVDRDIPLTPLTDKDKEAIKICMANNINHFALSFCNRGEDIIALRDLVGNDSIIISKVESIKGVENLSEILELSDSIIIDRGDLSRQVPIQEIPMIQKKIVIKANNKKTKVLVATNLLESMVELSYPTRAEVNDIYNTLLDGADGLVLAAETAIGKHPIESVRMINDVIDIFSEQKSLNNDTPVLNHNIADSKLIKPHGGKLIELISHHYDFYQIKELKSVKINNNIISDFRLIATGVYSPLYGFMDKENLYSVLNSNRLCTGISWTIPIIFQVPQKIAKDLITGEKIRLVDHNNSVIGFMDLQEIYQININVISKHWFGTDSINHPGVNRLHSQGNYCLAGPIKLKNNVKNEFDKYELTPRQSRYLFNQNRWKDVIGFHTRNVPHRVHEYIQKKALEMTCADGLFINPVLGEKKNGDFTSEIIMQSYKKLIDNGVYPKNQFVLGGFSTYSRYSGPREAVFTAICRKNMGCNYFIVGRDHAGVGNCYKQKDYQMYFNEMVEIEIKPVFFDEIGYDVKENKYSNSTINPKNIKKIEATSFREALLRYDKVPNWFVRDSVQNMLINKLKIGEKVFHGQ